MTSQHKLRVSILGAGYMGRVHSESWSKLDYVKIIKIYSRTLNKAKELASKFNAEATCNLDEAIMNERIDIVDICLPTFMHKEVAIKALRANKHVLLEKPIALSLEDARAIINEAKKAKGKFMVAHCLRFFPEYSIIKKIVDKGTIGEPLIARAIRIGSYPTWGSNNWFSDLSKSGGVAIDLIIHDLDYLRWIFNSEVKEVYAKINDKDEGYVRKGYHVMALLKFENGKLAYVEGSWAQPPTYPFTMGLELIGSHGSIIYNSSLIGRTVKVFKEKDMMEIQVSEESGYDIQIKRFAEAILNNLEPPIKPEDAYKALEISIAIIKSAEKNSIVRIT